MATGDAVTIVATFHVKPGRDADFEHWAHDITAAAAQFPGHMGASWLGSKGSYQVVYRFENDALFHDWHDSTARAEFLRRLEPIGALATDRHLSGLETWFELPDHPGRPAPPRWKMVVATWIGVFPILALLQWLFGARLAPLPLIARVMLLTLVVVLVMTYLVMPRITLAMKDWLYPE